MITHVDKMQWFRQSRKVSSPTNKQNIVNTFSHILKITKDTNVLHCASFTICRNLHDCNMMDTI